MICLFFVKHRTNIELQLKEKDVLFFYEYTVDFKIWYIVNLLIIYGKLFIHKCKWAVKKTNFTHFKTEISHYLYTLKETRNNKAKKTVNYFEALNLVFE